MISPVPYLTPCPNVFDGLLGDLMRRLTSGGAPAEIVAAILMAIASVLTQGLADVIWPNGLKASIGANNWVIAPTTIGKSLINKILIEPIEEYLAMCSKDNNSLSLDFFIEDATREAILQSLAGWPIASLYTDEAGIIKKLLRDAPTLVKLLDGSPIRSARVGSGRLALFEHRFCALFMEQPDLFEEKKPQLGASKGGVGLANRFFFSRLSGRGLDRSLHHVGLSGSLRQAYEERVRKLIDLSIRQVENKGNGRPALSSSAEATQYLLRLDNEVRRNCAPGGVWSSIPEYVSRHVERVLRLAGVLHVFEHGIEGEISVDTIRRADHLGQWYIESFALIFFEPPKQTQTDIDAMVLERALCEDIRTTGLYMFQLSEMRAHALNLGLTPARFTRALAALGERGRVRVVMHFKVSWIEINPFNLPHYS